MLPETTVREAIIRDLETDLTLAQIATQNNVTLYRVRTIAADAGIRRHREAAPLPPCAFCGTPTQSKLGVCLSCRLIQRVTWTAADALPAGEWVLKGGVKRYVVDENPPPPHCGSERGYQWHRYHDRDNWPLPDEDPCGCRAAHREHVRKDAAA